MKIGIDCRMYGLKHAGIGRYIANLVREVKSQKSKVKSLEITLLVRQKNLEEIKREVGDLFKIVVCDIPHYSFREQLLMPWILQKERLDLVHFPHFNVPVLYFGKYVVTIHDLIKHGSRGRETTTKTPLFYWFKYLGYRLVFWNAVKRAKRILVPSEWVKEELVRQYNLDAGKVVVTYEGVEEKLKTKNQKPKTKNTNLKILKKYGISKPFVIYTGSLYPHKNIEELIKAIKILNLSLITYCLSLVVVCSRNVFWERMREKVRELEAEKFVNFIGFVPDEELVALYQKAKALVQPSLMEGFDLTVVEAMAVGLPVVVSDIPVHREICGEAALYFDPANIKDMTDKIKLILDDEVLRKKLRCLGLVQVKKYNWQKTALKTVAVYKNVHLL